MGSVSCGISSTCCTFTVTVWLLMMFVRPVAVVASLSAAIPFCTICQLFCEAVLIVACSSALAFASRGAFMLSTESALPTLVMIWRMASIKSASFSRGDSGSMASASASMLSTRSKKARESVW